MYVFFQGGEPRVIIRVPLRGTSLVYAGGYEKHCVVKALPRLNLGQIGLASGQVLEQCTFSRQI